MLDHGTLDQRSVKLLEVYCRNYAIVRECDEMIEAEGMFDTAARGGTTQPHPSLTTRNTSVNTMLKIADSLGLTPNSQARITRAGKDGGKTAAKDDTWDFIQARSRKAGRMPVRDTN